MCCNTGVCRSWFHQTFRLDWLRVGISTSSLPKAEGLPKTPHVITLVFWPLHLDFSLPRSLKSTQPPPPPPNTYCIWGHSYLSISILPLIPHEIVILAYQFLRLSQERRHRKYLDSWTRRAQSPKGFVSPPLQHPPRSASSTMSYPYSSSVDMQDIPSSRCWGLGGPMVKNVAATARCPHSGGRVG